MVIYALWSPVVIVMQPVQWLNGRWLSLPGTPSHLAALIFWGGIGHPGNSWSLAESLLCGCSGKFLESYTKHRLRGVAFVHLVKDVSSSASPSKYMAGRKRPFHFMNLTVKEECEVHVFGKPEAQSIKFVQIAQGGRGNAPAICMQVTSHGLQHTLSWPWQSLQAGHSCLARQRLCFKQLHC